MSHLTLLVVVIGLLGGPISGQMDSKYDDDRARWRDNRQATRHCQSCNPEECPKPTECVAGVVRDPCHCCDVCGKAEFELCDHPRVNARDISIL